MCVQLCSALRDTSKFECKIASCTRKACCAVMSLEINNNEVGRWLAQVLFEAGPSQSVIGLTATCIPSLKSANRRNPLPSEAPVCPRSCNDFACPARCLCRVR